VYTLISISKLAHAPLLVYTGSAQLQLRQPLYAIILKFYQQFQYIFAHNISTYNVSFRQLHKLD